MTPSRLIDVSDAQHGGLPPGQGPPIDWKAVAGAGVGGVFIKTTQGTTYVNPWYAIDLAGALGAGIPAIGYHFAGMGDPAAEAAFFKEHAQARARMLDYETNTNVAWARTFLQTLGLGPGELITYGSASTLKDFYAQLPSMAFPAAYNQYWPGWGVCWQFTDALSVPGITGNVDGDQWQGDETQFDNLFGITEAPGGLEMLAPTPTGKGYWRVSPQGAVVTYGDAQYLGGPNTSNGPAWNGPPVLPPGRVVVSITAHPTEQGYWIEDNAGDLYAYGAAPYLNPN